MDILVTILIMLVCLATEAFFSGSEIAVVSADRIRLRHEAAQGSRGAKLALAMLEKPEWLLSTTLVGTNISVVTNTTMATALMIQLFGEQSSWLAILLVAPLIWIFGEIVAKSVFQQRADVITPRAIFALRAASYLFLPILAVFSVLTRGLTKLLGGESRNPFTLREEIAAMMEMSALEGDIRPMEQKMIRRVFSFGETTAGDIMIPLIDVVAVARSASCGEVRRLARHHAHKRLPVYEERIDRIVGTLNVLDLLREPVDRPIADFVRQPRFVPASISIERVLADLRKSGSKMAIVVDEFGGARGIVMLEDILEVIVGELEDEFDESETSAPLIRKLGDRDYLASTRIRLEHLQADLGLELPEGPYETLSGFLIETARAIPPAGAVIRYKNLTLTVERVTGPLVQEVRIRW